MMSPRSSKDAAASPFESPQSASRRSFTRSALAFLAFGAAGIRSAAAYDPFITFQTQDAFIAEAFGGAPPEPQMLNLDAAKQAQIRSVYNRPYPQGRLRYWRKAGRTAWVFDDLGKEGYVETTSGFIVKDAAIETARVLIYRESRGQQVGEPSFLKQLAGARAVGAGLDRKVDNISGATLSVKMMQRMARTALVLDTLAA